MDSPLKEERMKKEIVKYLKILLGFLDDLATHVTYPRLYN
jgi:hypothetical protein